MRLALQQIEDELVGPIDAKFLAETLRELFDEAAAVAHDSAGMRLHLATSTLHPRGERP
ncbi:hypothetical protein [Streptomyces sp. URMC 123]|uniref:hypothetical protein n=1 Tax=Streptomyces sp. URMC 123 TaxID=3423403 RepID=UPI003F1E03A9